MAFASRQDAGHQLGLRLQEIGTEVDIVAGLPRGGVVVAAVVADILQRPLDTVVVRKVGHPGHREFAIGALAEHDVLILDWEATRLFPASNAQVHDIIAGEREQLREHCRKFRPEGGNHFLGKSVLLVDDGLATGATAEAAVQAARAKGARRVIMAAPVAATSAWKRLARVADDIVVLTVDPNLDAVGHYYREFSQTTDEEVLALLHSPRTH